jgi:acetyl esterase/lipase
VFWIHGGGWQTGDKSGVQQKPRAFVTRGFVFVSTNYRLLPHVDMGTIIRDVAKSLGWVHKNIAVHGGDPRRIFVMGHSAGAQLAALICTDDRLLEAEGVPFSVLKGCVPVDGDTYDVPAIVANGEMRRRLHGQPEPKFGHRAKFGTEEQHREYSAVTHVVRGKGIPPFLLLHITENPDTRAQAQRLAAVLKDAGISVQVNANLGAPGDPTTVALFGFVDTALKMLAPGS